MVAGDREIQRIGRKVARMRPKSVSKMSDHELFIAALIFADRRTKLGKAIMSEYHSRDSVRQIVKKLLEKK